MRRSPEGYGLTLVRDKELFGVSLCVGEDHSPLSWKRRSCAYRNLCLNLSSMEYLLFTPPTIRARPRAGCANRPPLAHAPRAARRTGPENESVSLAPINVQWNADWDGVLIWAPKARVLAACLRSSVHGVVRRSWRGRSRTPTTSRSALPGRAASA